MSGLLDAKDQRFSDAVVEACTRADEAARLEAWGRACELHDELVPRTHFYAAALYLRHRDRKRPSTWDLMVWAGAVSEVHERHREALPKSECIHA